ncbi:MAG: hypothetical protein R3E97_22500 [Candidatus Eisenbacteria bacterium]
MVPTFLPPMLAVLGDAPFDSPDHLFEWKWDGFRALVSRTSEGLTIRSRRDRDLRPRFPDLDFLEALPEGCLLDGEIVALEEASQLRAPAPKGADTIRVAGREARSYVSRPLRGIRHPLRRRCAGHG